MARNIVIVGQVIGQGITCCRLGCRWFIGQGYNLLFAIRPGYKYRLLARGAFPTLFCGPPQTARAGSCKSVDKERKVTCGLLCDLSCA